MVRVPPDRVDPDAALALSDHQIVERWLALYRGSGPLRAWFDGALSAAEARHIEKTLIPRHRASLYSISHMMSKLNQTLAQMANAEDLVRGRVGNRDSNHKHCSMTPPASPVWRPERRSESI